jgi:hypothetical protein
MKVNEGSIDRIIRIIVGLALPGIDTCKPKGAA